MSQMEAVTKTRKVAAKYMAWQTFRVLTPFPRPSPLLPAAWLGCCRQLSDNLASERSQQIFLPLEDPFAWQYTLLPW